MSPEDKNSISQIHVSKDAKLLSRMESTEIVDFRVNEIRDLPTGIVKFLNNPICIAVVHFFLIRETNSELKLSHAEFKRCRILEKELWDSYLTDGTAKEKFCTPDQMLIYHWKEEQDKNRYLSKFSAFAKFSTIAVSNETLQTFMVYIIVLGIVSGVLANFIFSYFQQDSSTPIFISGVSSGVITAALYNLFYSFYRSEANQSTRAVIGIIFLYALLILVGALASSYYPIFKPDSNSGTSLNTQVFFGGIFFGAAFMVLLSFFYSLYKPDPIKKDIKMINNICWSCLMCIIFGALISSSYHALKPSLSALATKADVNAVPEQTSDKTRSQNADANLTKNIITEKALAN